MAGSVRWLDRLWYGGGLFSLLLSPLGWIFCMAVSLRRHAYASGLMRSSALPVPVIVVGNISLGGTGKTPLVVWLVHFTQALGYRPAVISRGYGGKARHWPQQVRPDSDPAMVGDEPVMISRRTGVPVAVGPKRVVAAQALMTYTDCDLIICDDGLQHLALERDIEIAVIDGERRFGNGRCLPAGPLRELPNRLDNVDLLVCNGVPRRGEFGMQISESACRNLSDSEREQTLDAFRGSTVHAVAGIGNPGRFFEALRHAGLDIITHEFRDHHRYKKSDIDFDDQLPVLMTEKDAVKCSRFADSHHWYMPIEALLPDTFARRLHALLKGDTDGQEAA